MKPGREIDALVAEKVMRWENNWDKPCGTQFPNMWGIMDYTDKGPVRAPNFPSYSEDIAAAWEVGEAVAKRFGWCLTVRGAFDTGCGYEARFGWRATEYPFSGCAPTPAHAICLAALKAVGS